jgi:uncharacterized protein YeaO (DUF488 family)
MARREYASPACLLGDGAVRGSTRPLRVRTKRIYEAPSRADGYRVLVDRLWPRGVSKESAHIAAWAQELAPSTALRRRFGHAPRKWSEFSRRYRTELKAHPIELDGLRAHARRRTLTLLYAAKDPEHNHARVLKAVLEAD